MNESKEDRDKSPGKPSDLAAEVGWDAFLRRARLRFARLTEADLATLDQIAFAVGNYEALVDRLRERYDLKAADAQLEVDKFLRAFLRQPDMSRGQGDRAR